MAAAKSGQVLPSASRTDIVIQDAVSLLNLAEPSGRGPLPVSSSVPNGCTLKIEVQQSSGSGSAVQTKPRQCQATTPEFLCTFKTTNGTFKDQHWFECKTCAPSGTDWGICTVCVNACHKGHRVRYMRYGGFMCDCGEGNGPVKCEAMAGQKDSLLCTFKETGKIGTKQHFFSCFTCNLVNDEGVCTACVNICHKDHDVRYSELSRSFFCDCGPSGKCQALAF